MSDRNCYTLSWQKNLSSKAKTGAALVLPHINTLINPASVVDIGCGTGHWLRWWLHSGVEDVLGLDGEWINQNILEIPKKCFQQVNLEERIELDRTFDLLMCIEVAEHLAPGNESAFVESLVRLSSVVLFSAAIPYQGGNGHINERWQSYWQQCFKRCGFEGYDIIRPKLWNCVGRTYWLAQNPILYVRKEEVSRFAGLSSSPLAGEDYALDLVHPVLWENRMKEYHKALSLRQSFSRAVKSLLRRIYLKD